MDMIEYLDAINETLHEMKYSATDEELDDLALTMYAVAMQMGWEIRLEYL